MTRLLPIVAAEIRAADYLQGLWPQAPGKNALQDLHDLFSVYLSAAHIFFLNSGTSSFFSILTALQKLSGRKEVILPAYTALPLLFAVQRTGLKPVLCDVSQEDFGMDARALRQAASPDTLCVTAVHLFGIIAQGARERFPGAWLIEDCAQSLGSMMAGKPAGTHGDVSFFSFARGKNIPTYGGGCIAINNKDVAGVLERIVREAGGQSLLFRASLPLKIAALSVAVRPAWYGLLYPFIRGLKERKPCADFKVCRYTDFQAAVALAVGKRIMEISQKRYDLGMRLISALKGLAGIRMPTIPQDTQPAFNRMPVIFEDIGRKERAQKKLLQTGIEATAMYPQPLHHEFALGYRRQDFPNSCYLAGHVLTLPVHPFVTAQDIERMRDTIVQTL